MCVRESEGERERARETNERVRERERNSECVCVQGLIGLSGAVSGWTFRMWGSGFTLRSCAYVACVTGP